MPMYAIFEAGGRQHRAEAGKTVKMDRLDAETGATGWGNCQTWVQGSWPELGLPDG